MSCRPVRPKIPRNPHARALARPLFRPRLVKQARGRGSYRRTPKHRGAEQEG